jgi:hypothetical protein
MRSLPPTVWHLSRGSSWGRLESREGEEISSRDEVEAWVLKRKSSGSGLEESNWAISFQSPISVTPGLTPSIHLFKNPTLIVGGTRLTSASTPLSPRSPSLC